MTAASTKDTMTAGPAYSAAACAPTEKMPAPTATATPMTAMSQAESSRLRLRSGSSMSWETWSMVFLTNRLIAALPR